MTKRNGLAYAPEIIDVPEFGSVGNTRLFRAAMNLWLIKQGEPQALTALGRKGQEMVERRKRSRNK